MNNKEPIEYLDALIHDIEEGLNSRGYATMGFYNKELALLKEIRGMIIASERVLRPKDNPYPTWRA